MFRNLMIILFGIVPASLLGLLAIGVATLGAGMIGNGSNYGWVYLALGVIAVIGTAAFFATVLFPMHVATKVGLLLWCIAAFWTLLIEVRELDSGVMAIALLILSALSVAVYVLSREGLFHRR